MSKLRQVELNLVENPFLFNKFTEEGDERSGDLLSSISRNYRVVKETRLCFDVYYIYLSVSVKSRTNSALALFFHIENVTFWVSIVFLSVLNT